MTNSFTDIYDRNELLWGKEAQKELFKKHVAVIGLGGVGSYIAEALARSGVGTITLVDYDTVSETNINRQLTALTSNIGEPKSTLMKDRISLINPNIKVIEINKFCYDDLVERIIESKPDYVADAIDTVKAKIDVIDICKQKGVPVITSLGAGNRLNPEDLYLADISEVDTTKCSFVKNVVFVLNKIGIKKDLPVVASRERPFKLEKRVSHIKVKQDNGETVEFNKFSPGSSPFVPPVAGFIMASYIVKSLIAK